MHKALRVWLEGSRRAPRLPPRCPRGLLRALAPGRRHPIVRAPRRASERPREYGFADGAATEQEAPPAVPQLTVSERVARGKAARREVPRSSHAFYEDAGRPDPIKLLESQAATRVPELVPIRYGRMLVSPFTFYRGAALMMASDLAPDAPLGAHGAVLRRRPSLQLRRLRLARARADVRHQRLRRDATRAMGVGRQAPGGEHADRGARSTDSPRRTRSRVVLDTVARPTARRWEGSPR